MTESQPLFDYDDLDLNTQSVVRQSTELIKKRMRRSAEDIIEIGKELIFVKERLGHGKFGEWLKAEFDWTWKTATRFMSVTEQFKFDNLSNLDIAPSALYFLAAPSTPDNIRQTALAKASLGERVTHSWVKELIESSDNKNGTSNDSNPSSATSGDNKRHPQVAQSRKTETPNATPRDTRMQQHEHRANSNPEDEDDSVGDDRGSVSESNTRIINDAPRNDAPHNQSQGTPNIPRLSHEPFISSNSIEHYTPPEIIKAVLECFGGKIDLDPCSNSHHSPNVPSQYRFTIDDDGLAHSWKANTLYMNPPYSDVKNWVQKVIQEYQNGNTTSAIILVKSDTSTKWFELIWLHAVAVCFVHHRLAFLNPSNRNNSATFASAIAYFGQDIGGFYYAFHKSIGVCVQVMQHGVSFGE